MNWFLHGALGTPDDWEEWLGTDGVAVNLYEAVAPFDEWASAFCERVRAADDAPALVGYSMGGRLALHALLADPGMWRSAVIVSAHTGLASNDKRAARLDHDLVWARRARELPWSNFLADWSAQLIFNDTADVRSGRKELESRRADVAAAFDHWSLGRQAHLLPLLPQLDLPVTWVVGERDAKFSSIARSAVDRLPQGCLEIVPNAGHRVPWDQPERFRTFVRADFD